MDYFSLPTRERFALRGVFTLTEPITYENVERFCQAVSYFIDEDTEEITVLISSPGGDVAGATCFADFTDLFGSVRIKGVAIGECGSAAFTMLQFCDERVALRQCVFLIHHMHIGVHVVLDGKQEQQALASIRSGERANNMLVARICRRAGIKRSDWKRLADEGELAPAHRTADEMLELGFLDDIIDVLPLF